MVDWDDLSASRGLVPSCDMTLLVACWARLIAPFTPADTWSGVGRGMPGGRTEEATKDTA